MILFEAIGRGETDRCLRGRDRRAVCLSERHVEPHLVISDMAAGQWVDPSMRRSIHGAGQSRSHDDRGPRESFLASRCGSGTSGRASPSLRHQPRNDFLILIVGDSHLDCRATVWLYHVFSLSLRDVELLLAERGVVVSYETVRRWC